MNAAPTPSRDASTLRLALGLVLSVWAFVAIAGMVSGGGTQQIDDRIMHMLRQQDDVSKPLAPWWVTSAMRDITSLGSATVLILFTLAVVAALAVRRQTHALLLVVAATAGGELLNAGLKSMFQRPRPPLLLHLTDVDSTSFPSGHAMDSAVIYLTLAVLLARLEAARPLRTYFLCMALLLTLLIGTSRVYLGVHYPSDVLAGWCAGLAWALLCWGVAAHLQHRGSVEPPSGA